MWKQSRLALYEKGKPELIKTTEIIDGLQELNLLWSEDNDIIIAVVDIVCSLLQL